MNDSTAAGNSTSPSMAFGIKTRVPVVLVAHAKASTRSVDRCLVTPSFFVGRNSDADLPILDDKVSKHHLRITRDGDMFWIEDLGSTNGTYVNGRKIVEKNPLANLAVIRIGGAVLVFCNDGESLLDPAPAHRYDMAGRFHVASFIVAPN